MLARRSSSSGGGSSPTGQNLVLLPSLNTDLLPAVSRQEQMLAAVSLQLADLGSARQASTHAALHAAHTALAVGASNGEDSSLRAAWMAAHCARQCALVAYTDAVLDRAAAAIGSGAAAKEHLVNLLRLCRASSSPLLRTDEELAWPGSAVLVSALVYLAQINSGDVASTVANVLRQCCSGGGALVMDSAQMRRILLAMQQAWHESRALSFREACLLVLQQSEMTQHAAALTCALLGSAYNLARRQPMGNARARLMVTIVLTAAAADGNKEGEGDLELSWACFGAVSAMDELGGRFRDPSATTPAADSSSNHHQKDNALTQYAAAAAAAAGADAGMVMELALGLSEVVDQLNSGEENEYEIDGDLLVGVLANCDVLVRQQPSSSLVSVAWEAMRRGRRPSPPPAPAAAVTSQLRLFHDWTSEEDDTSDDEDDEDDENGEGKRRRNLDDGRLGEVRALVSRYGVFHTTHPEDRNMLANPAVVQLRHWEPPSPLGMVNTSSSSSEYEDDDEEEEEDDE